MIPPGALVMLTPVIVGVLFGTRTLAGVLAGALVSGVQMAVSMSNTGGGGPHSHRFLCSATPAMLPVMLLALLPAHVLPAQQRAACVSFTELWQRLCAKPCG